MKKASYKSILPRNKTHSSYRHAKPIYKEARKLENNFTLTKDHKNSHISKINFKERPLKQPSF